MQKKHIQTLLIVGMAFILSACAGGISRQARSQVTYSGPFSSVVQNPGQFPGETVMWGGRVIETRAMNGATEVEVLQLPLDSAYRPVNRDQSQGRFLIRSAQFLDPAVYPPGTLITVVGHLLGPETGFIGEMSYVYPVIDVIEINKWDPAKYPSSRVHIGIGISGRF